MYLYILCGHVAPQIAQKVTDALIQVWEEIPQEEVSPRAFLDIVSRHMEGIHTAVSHDESQNGNPVSDLIEMSVSF